jgi:hypothetical protein
VEGEEGVGKEDGKTEFVPNFAGTHEALMKLNLSFMRTARVTVIVKVF